MATYDLKYPGAAIDAILDTAYDLQNAGYIFRGLASEYYNTPTERSWVLAGEGETGHGFTSPVPKGYIGVCVFNGTSWTGKLLKCVSIDSTPTNGSTNAVSSGGAYASISQLADTVNEALDNLTFTDTTPSAFLGNYINMKVSTTDGGIERILTFFTILAATAEKAGLLSAADKQKLDAILGNLRSLKIDDTTAYADLGTKIVESIKATIGGQEETISTFQILAATAEKAGLLSAADKQKLDAILGNLRSLEIDDTTAYADLGTKIVESIKATIGGQEETISTFQILAATASKAGLLSAADKAELDALWSSGYQFAGIATPSTTPISTTSKIFYIATEAGTYFNAVTVTQGINILSWNGSTWSAVQVIGIDDEPTPDSDNLLKSGGAASVYGYYTDNPEYKIAFVDGNKKLLYGVKEDGSFDWSIGIPKHVLDTIKYYGFEVMSDEEDRLYITFDNQGKVINYRKKDGTLVECVGLKTPYIETDYLKFQKDGLKKLEDELIEDGFNTGGGGKELRILVIGSSGEQDIVAYLPPILDEVLYDYNIVYGCMYSSGSQSDDYVNYYINNIPCTHLNIWTPDDKRWSRIPSMTLEAVLSMYNWNLIIFKGNQTNNRKFMRIIQDVVNYPVAFATDARYPRVYDGSWQTIVEGIKNNVKNSALIGYFPVATAIQNARGNDALKMTGSVSCPQPTEFSIPAGKYLSFYHEMRTTGGDSIVKATLLSGNTTVNIYASISAVTKDILLLELNDSEEHETTFAGGTTYIVIDNIGEEDCTVVFEDSHTTGDFMLYKDNQHLQAGMPCLICGYTMALNVIKWTGNEDRGIAGCTFIPTNAKLIDIGCITLEGEESNGLGHGYPCGIEYYLGTDGNLYDMSELTKFGTDFYVTTSVFNNSPDENSIKAVLDTNGHINYKGIYAAQEIAAITVKSPDELVDCSGVDIDIPQKA